MQKIIGLKAALLFSLTIIIAFESCKKKEDDPISEYSLGKNRFTTTVNGDTREYYVHVPTNYNSNTATPVVFMLHGTSGDGDKFYNISGWKEVGEAEGIITVFPSSWHYCIIEDGQTLNTTKWNIYPAGYVYCNGETPRDDIAFLRQIITEIKSKLSVDEKRIYLVGFSAGGQMAFRCGVEMSDVLAAVIANAGTFFSDTTLVPFRNLPIAFQLGNEDDRYFTSPAPLSGLEYALNNVPIFQNIVHSHLSTFQYSPNYTISGDTNTAVIATYPPIPPSENRSFGMVLVKDLAHEYPNGSNHWMKGAEQHWDWLKQYSLP